MNSSPTDLTAMLLTLEQAAKTLAISERKLWSMSSSSEIPSIRIGRSVSYPVTDLQQWIEEQSKGSVK